MATRLTGTVPYVIVVKESIDEIENMSDDDFNVMVNSAIDWRNISSQIQTDAFEVSDIEEVNDL